MYNYLLNGKIAVTHLSFLTGKIRMNSPFLNIT